MASLQPVRGMHDILGSDMRKFQRISTKADDVFARYNYEKIATPIVEFSDVFKRTLGDETDIVTKEMYTFDDRGGESLTLRPENTASVVRAILSNSLTQSLPLKYYYMGPMFRYERPQKGRQRQFHQVGAEVFGSPNPSCDAETIQLGLDFLSDLGLSDLKLQLNTLGDSESRRSYRDSLVGYFQKYEQELSDDSKMRLQKNPLRILDSKDEGDKKIIEGAPVFDSYMNKASQSFFDSLQNHLGILGIQYERNTKLVRGLDYYNHSVFEIVSDHLGSQATVLAGGRYDGLVKTMGGPDIPAVGWASGVERLMLLMNDVSGSSKMLCVIAAGTEAEAPCLKLASDLRGKGYGVDYLHDGNMKKRLKHADKIGAKLAIIIGENELATAQATCRNLSTGVQETIPIARLDTYLKEHL